MASRNRTIIGREMPVAEACRMEQPHLLPLTEEHFGIHETLYPLIVDGKGRVKVKTNWYSVPLWPRPASDGASGRHWSALNMAASAWPGIRATMAAGARYSTSNITSTCWKRNPARWPDRRRWSNDVRPDDSPSAWTGSGEAQRAAWQERRPQRDDYAGAGRTGRRAKRRLESDSSPLPCSARLRAEEVSVAYCSVCGSC